MNQRRLSLSLAVSDRAGGTKYFPLESDEGRLLLGRDPGCQIPLPDSSVSKRHATITVDDEGTAIEDGADGTPSSNGVYLNDTRIGTGRKSLREGDVLKIGVFRFEVRATEAVQQAIGLDQVTGPREFERYLSYGGHQADSDEDVAEMAVTLGLTRGELSALFDRVLDQAMGQRRLPVVAAVSRLKQAVLDRFPSAPGEPVARDMEGTATRDIEIVRSGGSNKLIIMALVLSAAVVAGVMIWNLSL